MLSIDNDRCIQCGACVEECFKHALTMEGEKVVHNPDQCIWCGHCLALCPRDCIIIDGDGYNCEEVEEIGFTVAATKAQIRNMILLRRSIRYFTDDPVTDEEMNFIIEAGKYAPTGRNRQGNSFVAVRDEKVAELTADSIAAFKRLLSADVISDDYAELVRNACNSFDEGVDELYFQAPLVIFVFADTDVDGAICATNMGFMAQSQQLGYCFARIPLIAWEDTEFAAKWKAPEGKRAALALMIGNPEHEFFCSVPRKDPGLTVFE